MRRDWRRPAPEGGGASIKDACLSGLKQSGCPSGAAVEHPETGDQRGVAGTRAAAAWGAGQAAAPLHLLRGAQC